VTDDGSGTETFTRVNNLETSPYYRWDKSNGPEIVAFPPGFRMIAHSNDAGANVGGESGGNMLTECCQFDDNGEEGECETWDRLHFPTRTCGFLGIAMGKSRQTVLNSMPVLHKREILTNHMTPLSYLLEQPCQPAGMMLLLVMTMITSLICHIPPME
jgi:hypothetical protein